MDVEGVHDILPMPLNPQQGPVLRVDWDNARSIFDLYL